MRDLTNIGGSQNLLPSKGIGPEIHTADEAMVRINRDIEEKSVFDEAKRRDMGYVEIATTPINPDLLYLIPPETAKNALIIPFFRIGKKIRVAVAHPENANTQEAILMLKNSGYLININLASEHGLKQALSLYDAAYHEKKVLDNTIQSDELQAYEQEIQSLTHLQEKFSEITSEEALNYINVGAIKTGASDIHFQPEEKDVLMRFRIDGVLQNIFRIDKHIFENIANQLKYKAKMKLNITNTPQDGRLSFIVNKRKIDVRVSSLPTEFGETFVLRLLDSDRGHFDFETLGFQGIALEQLKRVTKLVYGMVLVTGPTGSGKTTTLYSLLDKLNNPERKIITLEDPIEYHLPMISQSQINEKRGYDFTNGLRAILRQDPDIIMFGEIRDLPAAETAAQAALTGHLVLSTLHTNTAVETISRLLNMGLEPFMVVSSLTTVIAQRLVRRICPSCAEEKPLRELEKKELMTTIETIHSLHPNIDITLPLKLKRARGCEKCSHTGYLGQIAIVEVFEIDDDIRNNILNGRMEAIFDEARKKKMLTMKEDGILKVLEGITTLSEVNRVTNARIEDDPTA